MEYKEIVSDASVGVQKDSREKSEVGVARGAVLGALTVVLLNSGCELQPTVATPPRASATPVIRPVPHVPSGPGLIAEPPLQTLPSIPIQPVIKEVVDTGTEIGKKTWEWTKEMLASGKAVLDKFQKQLRIEATPDRILGDTLWVDAFPISIAFQKQLPEGSIVDPNAEILWQIYTVERRLLVQRREGELLRETTGERLEHTFGDTKEYLVKMSAYGTSETGNPTVYTTTLYIRKDLF